MPSPKKLMMLSVLLGVLGLGGFSTGLPSSLVSQACAFTSCDPTVANCCNCVQCRVDQDGDGFCVGSSVPKCGPACPAGWRAATSCNSLGPDCNDSIAYNGTNDGSGYVPAVACDPSVATTTANCHTSTYQRADGNCGQNTCPANAPSTNTNCNSLPCHTNTQTFIQSNCSSVSCNSNAPAYQACPVACGQPAVDLPDGNCGTHHCNATSTCISCPTPGIGVNGWNNSGNTVITEYSNSTCTGVAQTYWAFQWVYNGNAAWYVSAYGAYPGQFQGWSTSNAMGVNLNSYSTPCGCYYYFNAWDGTSSGGANQVSNSTGIYCVTVPGTCTTH